MLFLGTVINYIDRMTLNFVKPDVQKQLQFSDFTFGVIVAFFQFAYAAMFPVTGRLMDILGTRLGYIVCIGWWSAAGMLHAAARKASHFMVFRAMLGAGEGGSWTAGVKGVAEWFPARERSLAVGIWNGGSSVGGIIVGPLVAWILLRWGWRPAFILTGLIGFAWLFVWALLYHAPDKHPWLSAEELAYIEAGQREAAGEQQHQERLRWADLFRFRQAWGLLLFRLFMDQTWWFYVTWVPSYLRQERGVEILAAGILYSVPFLCADVGSISGGWLSGLLYSRGVPLSTARKAVIVGGCLLMLMGIPAVYARSPIVTVMLIGVVTYSYTVASANILTLPADLVPANLTGSLTGLSGFFAGAGGIAMNLSTGLIKDRFGSYKPLFIAEALIPLIGAAMVLFVMGQIRRLSVREEEPQRMAA
jgi:ACS family hexuronate transporter-like MFS transporter